MDVTLVLTHRCNLGCHYCYAGEHHKRTMDRATMERALDLLYADGCDTAQLGFFGGEPFLAWDVMREAIAGAERRALAAGARLILQCTTNGTLLGTPQVETILRTGMRVTVSIDGVAEAHDAARPLAGGGSSFAAVHGGLRALIDAGARPDALMVITPETARHVARSVAWLWGEGVETVRANLMLTGRWSLAERDDLRRELVAVGRQMLWRRVAGQPARFEPFDRGLARAQPGAQTSCSAGRPHVVVATEGNLYPCSPMVGEDRERGPEAAVRIGHLWDGTDEIRRRVAAEGAGCGDGRACACAAYLETGDRASAGANGLWYSGVCAEVGEAVGLALAQARRPSPETRPPLRDHRRALALPLILGAGGLTFGGAVQLASVVDAVPQARYEGPLAGAIAAPMPEPELRPPGDMAVPEPEPKAPEPVGGGVVKPPEPPKEVVTESCLASDPLCGI